jgi:hypothetical protein
MSYYNSNIDDFNAYINKYVVETSSLCMALDMIEMSHEDMIRRANYKLTCESGTYEDALYLYEEANKETSSKQDGILTRLFKWIGDALKKIQTFLFGTKDDEGKTNLDKAKEKAQEGKSNGEEVPDLDVPADYVKQHKSVIAEFKAWAARGFEGDIPDTIKDFTKKGAAVVAVGGAAKLTWDSIMGILSYVGGDSSALAKIKNQLEKKAEETTDEGKKTLLSHAAKLLNSIIATHSSVINKVVGGLCKAGADKKSEKYNKKLGDLDKQISDLEKKINDSSTDPKMVERYKKQLEKLKKQRENADTKFKDAVELSTGAETTQKINDIVKKAKGSYYQNKVKSCLKHPDDKEAYTKVHEELEEAKRILNSPASKNKISNGDRQNALDKIKTCLDDLDHKEKDSETADADVADAKAPDNDSTTESWFDIDAYNDWTNFTFESSEELDDELREIIDEL